MKFLHLFLLYLKQNSSLLGIFLQFPQCTVIYCQSCIMCSKYISMCINHIFLPEKLFFLFHSFLLNNIITGKPVLFSGTDCIFEPFSRFFFFSLQRTPYFIIRNALPQLLFQRIDLLRGYKMIFKTNFTKNFRKTV